MKKFEYKRIYHEVGYRELDMIGEAGSELVAVEPSKVTGTLSANYQLNWDVLPGKSKTVSTP